MAASLKTSVLFDKSTSRRQDIQVHSIMGIIAHNEVQFAYINLNENSGDDWKAPEKVGKNTWWAGVCAESATKLITSTRAHYSLNFGNSMV